MSTTALPQKHDVARMLLLRGSAFVHLDPREVGVVVPPWLREQAQLVLQIGLDMPVAIPDLRVDVLGVSGTLSFQRAPFTCSVPWSAVFALVGDDGRGMVWPTDFPPEIASEVARETAKLKHLRSVVPSVDETKTIALPLSDDELHAAEITRSHSTARAKVDRVRADGEPAPAVAAVAPSSDRGRQRAHRRRTLPSYLRVVK